MYSSIRRGGLPTFLSPHSLLFTPPWMVWSLLRGASPHPCCCPCPRPRMSRLTDSTFTPVFLGSVSIILSYPRPRLSPYCFVFNPCLHIAHTLPFVLSNCIVISSHLFPFCSPSYSPCRAARLSSRLPRLVIAAAHYADIWTIRQKPNPFRTHSSFPLCDLIG